jgi:hypothetical protein
MVMMMMMMTMMVVVVVMMIMFFSHFHLEFQVHAFHEVPLTNICIYSCIHHLLSLSLFIHFSLLAYPFYLRSTDHIAISSLIISN